MLDLSLRPSLVNGNGYADDYGVIWTSETFGARRVALVEHADREMTATSPRERL